MKFALLGADLDSLRLAEAALAEGHEIVWLGDLGDNGSIAPTLAGGDRADDWEDLLDDESAAAIIIGRGAAAEELRARQLQELARLGRPALVTHPIVSSLLTYFEVDMARTESGAVLQHFNPLLTSFAVDQLADWVRDGHPELGRIEQVVCTRRLDNRSRGRVTWHFVRDVELLDRVAGRLNRIAAHAGAAPGEADYSALSVQLLGPSEVPVRWAVEPPAAAEGAVLTLIFQRGRETLEFNDRDGFDPELTHDRSPTTAVDDASTTPAVLAVRRFTEAVIEKQPTSSTWPSALHAMELGDSIEISLRRGRMIDVHDQQLTEQMAFKGTMAAVGCGLLVVLIPLMLAVGWIAGLLGVPVARFWPHALLALLTLFLAFQLLPKVLYGAPPPAEK